MIERDHFSSNEEFNTDDEQSSYLDILRTVPRDDLEYHLSWGATPLAGTEYPDVLKFQNTIIRPMLLQRVEQSAPDNVPLPLRHFMEQGFLTRFVGRSMKNYEAYSERLVKLAPDEMSEAFYEQHERSMRGTASPRELLIERRTRGMKAVELARQTHPYGEMIDELDLMRDAVDEAILEQGGIILPPEDYQEQYKLRTTDLLMNPDTDNQAIGLLMTRRRMKGMFDDDTAILERSSFVVPIYEGSQFDPKLSRRMRQVPMIDNPDRMHQLEQAGRLSEVIPELLQANNFEAAIPLSTTTFAYNQTTDHAIKEEMARSKSRSSLDRILSMTRQEPNYRSTDKDMIVEAYNSENIDQE
jgi:hypothetical protein